jgi:hypothetical protein
VGGITRRRIDAIVRGLQHLQHLQHAARLLRRSVLSVQFSDPLLLPSKMQRSIANNRRAKQAAAATNGHAMFL